MSSSLRAGRVSERRTKPAPRLKPVADRQYRALFERSPQPLMVYERRSLRMVAVSDSAVESYGYSREELLAMTIVDLLPPEDREALVRFVAVDLGGEEPGRVTDKPWRVQRKDGQIIDVEVTSDDLEFDGAKCRMTFYQDVTERNAASAELATTREQLHSSEERYRLLFEQNPQPMIAFNRRTLEIVAVSNAMVKIYGYSREEFASMSILDLALAEDVDALRSFFAQDPRGSRPAPDGSGAAYPRRRQAKDGTVIDVEITSDNVVLDGQDCRIAMYADVTERNRVVAELAIARDRAVEASNTKSAFLANMSHELRTPMNGVIGMNELLLDSGLGDEQRSYAQQVARSGEQMLAIINDILDISKLEAGHLDLDVTDFDLRETVAAACAGPRAQALAKGLRFEIHFSRTVLQTVRGDGRRLQQLVLNLTSNAVKFTPSGAVSVRVGSRRTGDGALIRIAVTDSGIGIDQTHLQQLFEPFTQADVSTTRLYGGTGLGLAIVRELAELMGGSVTAESTPGKGTTFSLQLRLALPASEAPAAAPVEAVEAPSWSSPPLVLVAEDSPVNQIVAARAIERLGCRVDVVADGEAALAALASREYDAVLMDCQMPRMDGYAATECLRLRERDSRHTPVIAMTAHAMAGDRERCIAAGMDDYIAKPMRRLELAAALRQWIPARPTAGRGSRARAAS
jgi:PAS domain S-box-containing protein